jgi:hypothetical protein
LLKRRGFINEEFDQLCTDLWSERDNYHHLNEVIEIDRSRLESLALSKYRTLSQIEKWVFAYTVTNGCINPKHPKYWPDKGKGNVLADARISP